MVNCPKLTILPVCAFQQRSLPGSSGVPPPICSVPALFTISSCHIHCVFAHSADSLSGILVDRKITTRVFFSLIERPLTYPLSKEVYVSPPTNILISVDYRPLWLPLLSVYSLNDILIFFLRIPTIKVSWISVWRLLRCNARTTTTKNRDKVQFCFWFDL